VIYGAGQPASTITIDRADLRRALSTDAGRNALIRLEIAGGETSLALVREIQRHPVRRDVTHIDFLKVDPEKPVEIDIPVRLVGEARKVTTNGGITEQRINTVRLRVKPSAIPTAVEVDISEMTIDRSILVADLVLPEGATSVSKPRQAVVTAELTRAAVTKRGSGDEEAEES
jgi:large subunit ribosomal protein L25